MTKKKLPKLAITTLGLLAVLAIVRAIYCALIIDGSFDVIERNVIGLPSAIAVRSSQEYNKVPYCGSIHRIDFHGCHPESVNKILDSVRPSEVRLFKQVGGSTIELPSETRSLVCDDANVLAHIQFENCGQLREFASQAIRPGMRFNETRQLVKNSSRLETLRLVGYDIPDASELNRLSAIRHLSLESSQCDLQFLGSLKRLEEINLFGARYDADVMAGALLSLPHLRILYLDESKTAKSLRASASRILRDKGVVIF